MRQLDALAEKMERKTKIGDLAQTAKEAESTAQGWLTVLARCFQLQDVYGTSVSKDLVSRVTDVVMEQMQVWAGRRPGRRLTRRPYRPR